MGRKSMKSIANLKEKKKVVSEEENGHDSKGFVMVPFRTGTNHLFMYFKWLRKGQYQHPDGYGVSAAEQFYLLAA